MAIYAGQRLKPEAPLYNIAHSFQIPIAIDIEVFHQAFQKVINEADALRTIFFEEDSIPYQGSVPEMIYRSETIDFSLEDNEHKVEDWMAKRSQQIFCLKERLFDSVLIKREANRFIWFLNAHHLITDATASTILYRRTLDHYFASTKGSVTNVESLPSYSAYLEFEGAQKKGLQHKDSKKLLDRENKKPCCRS